MTRQKMYGLVVLVLVIALNGAFPTRLIEKWSAIKKASSEQNQQLQQQLVGEAKMQRNMPIRCIGSLTQDRWLRTSVLPLTEEQKKVMLFPPTTRLIEGRYQTRLADAVAVTADPTPQCEQLLLQSWNRQLEAIRHAIRLVSLGLLTEEQAAFVIQRDVALNGLSALYADKNVVELIGLSADQRLKLDELKAEATANANAFMTLAFKTDPQSVKECQHRNRRPEAVNDAAVRRTSRRTKWKKWNQLTASFIFASETPNATRSALSGCRDGGSPHFGSFTDSSRLGHSRKCRRSLGRSEDAFEGP